jgi:hypothetical protein
MRMPYRLVGLGTSLLAVSASAAQLNRADPVQLLVYSVDATFVMDSANRHGPLWAERGGAEHLCGAPTRRQFGTVHHALLTQHWSAAGWCAMQLLRGLEQVLRIS